MNSARKSGLAVFAALTLLGAGCATRNDYSAVDRAHPHAINTDAPPTPPGHYKRSAPMYSKAHPFRPPSTSPTRAASPCQYRSPANERVDADSVWLTDSGAR
jgi:hypothetical protein